jgi:hypothetical protein
VQVALQLERPVSVGVGSAGAVDWFGDLLVIGVFEDAFEVVGERSFSVFGSYQRSGSGLAR